MRNKLDLENFARYIGFRTISQSQDSFSEHEECVRWMKEYLVSFCDSVEIYQTKKRPVLIARVGSGRQVLIYGHYDVVHASKTEGWYDDPFKLLERDGKLFGRGVSDNKGHFWTCVQAVKNLLVENQLPCQVVFFLEGEEEAEGDGTLSFIEQEGKRILAGCDLALLVDSHGLTTDIELLTLGTRGNTTLTGTWVLRDNDVHSGMYGGLLKNPVLEASKLISDMQDYRKIPGFMDDFVSPEFEFEIDKFITAARTRLGASADSEVWGDDTLNFITVGLYPSIEVTGISAGYTGPGVQNAIPSKIQLKFSIRTAYNQNTEACANALMSYLRSVGHGVWDFSDFKPGRYENSQPYRISFHDKDVTATYNAIKNATGNLVLPHWSGGSLPIAPFFLELGIKSIIFGFGLLEDNIHGVNENMKISQMEKGFRIVQEVLAAISQT